MYGGIHMWWPPGEMAYGTFRYSYELDVVSVYKSQLYLIIVHWEIIRMLCMLS